MDNIKPSIIYLIEELKKLPNFEEILSNLKDKINYEEIVNYSIETSHGNYEVKVDNRNILLENLEDNYLSNLVCEKFCYGKYKNFSINNLHDYYFLEKTQTIKKILELIMEKKEINVLLNSFGKLEYLKKLIEKIDFNLKYDLKNISLNEKFNKIIEINNNTIKGLKKYKYKPEENYYKKILPKSINEIIGFNDYIYFIQELVKGNSLKGFEDNFIKFIKYQQKNVNYGYNYRNEYDYLFFVEKIINNTPNINKSLINEYYDILIKNSDNLSDDSIEKYLTKLFNKSFSNLSSNYTYSNKESFINSLNERINNKKIALDNFNLLLNKYCSEKQKNPTDILEKLISNFYISDRGINFLSYQFNCLLLKKFDNILSLKMKKEIQKDILNKYFSINILIKTKQLNITKKEFIKDNEEFYINDRVFDNVLLNYLKINNIDYEGLFFSQEDVKKLMIEKNINFTNTEIISNTNDFLTKNYLKLKNEINLTIDSTNLISVIEKEFIEEKLINNNKTTLIKNIKI